MKRLSHRVDSEFPVDKQKKPSRPSAWSLWDLFFPSDAGTVPFTVSEAHLAETLLKSQDPAAGLSPSLGVALPVQHHPCHYSSTDTRDTSEHTCL